MSAHGGRCTTVRNAMQSVQRDDWPADVSRLGRICTGARQNCIISVAASAPLGRKKGEWHDGEKAKARTQESGEGVEKVVVGIGREGWVGLESHFCYINKLGAKWT